MNVLLECSSTCKQLTGSGHPSYFTWPHDTTVSLDIYMVNKNTLDMKKWRGQEKSMVNERTDMRVWPSPLNFYVQILQT